jgi:hypothetical protein
MQVKTWLQRLTDESNLWFNAVKAEDESDLVRAVEYYVKDASECIKQHSLVRAALSCSCAASCLARMGAGPHAQTLYSEAAGIYMENAGVAMSESIRETLWSLQEAYENFALAGDADAASSVRDRYVALAARTNPFTGAEQAIKELDSRKASAVSKTAKEIPDSLASDIENFVQSRKSNSSPETFDPSYVLKAIDARGGSRLDEKSIAS